MSNGFLPISKQDMIDEGIEQLDFVYVCGDAYVDHPSFGHAIIARLLQAHGYTVGIISQPDWKDDESISILGVPRLGFLVSAGNMANTPNTRTSTRRLNLNYKDPTGGNYDRSKDKKCKYDISGIVQLCNEYKLSKHERNFRTGAEFWRDRDACDRLEHDIGQTESDFHYRGFDVYRDQSALACVQDIQAVEDKPFV